MGRPATCSRCSRCSARCSRWPRAERDGAGDLSSAPGSSCCSSATTSSASFKSLPATTASQGITALWPERSANGSETRSPDHLPHNRPRRGDLSPVRKGIFDGRRSADSVAPMGVTLGSRMPPARGRGVVRARRLGWSRRLRAPVACCAAAVVVGVLAWPMLLTSSGLGGDWEHHLWYVWQQSLSIRANGAPSFFLNTPYSVVYPQYAFYGGTINALA